MATPSSDERPPELLNLIHAREKSHPRKFLAGSIAVAIVALVAVVGLIALASGGSTKVAPFTQDAWQPGCDTDFDCDKAHQIAAYVAKKYVLADKKAAVTILSGPPTVAGSDGTMSLLGAIVERNDRGSVVTYTDAAGDNTVQYALCGFAADCQLTGAPSVARGDLIRRQALELALLTFKFEPSVKSTLVYFPKPPKSTDTAYVLFFHRKDYKAQLERPLADTIGKGLVLGPAGMTEPIASKIGSLTAPRVFSFAYRQAQQGTAYVLLTPAAY